MQKELKLSNNTAKLHQMFGKKLYANKFSFISEICQNAVDSHRMAGVKEPVIVGIDNKNVFYVKDVGLSFSDKEDFVNKVCTILESGKSSLKTDGEDCPMGEHGIGSISVSAYHSKWKYTVITPTGRKFTCVLKEVEGKGLTYDMSGYTPTDEPKSVLFEVDVAPFGIPAIIEGMKEKLCYFKDILFQFSENIIKQFPQLLVINNSFKLFQSDDFQISTLNKTNELHISLDQYSYPIRWSILGISPIKMPIALKFSMADGLTADITRENLCHTDNYKPVILEKIEKVADWFVNKYNEKTPDEFESIKEVAAKRGEHKKVKIENIEYDIETIINKSQFVCKPIKFKGVSDGMVDRFISRAEAGKAFFTLNYEISSSGHKLKREKNQYYYRWRQSLHILVEEGGIPTNMLAYLRKAYRGCGLYYWTKMHLFKGDLSYHKIIGLQSKSEMRKIYFSTGRNVWREAINECKILERSAAKDYLVSIKDIIIPESEKKTRSKPTRKTKEEIGVKYAASTLISTYEWNCKFVEKTLNVGDLYKQPFLHIYGTESKRRKLDNLYTLVKGGGGLNNIVPCLISEKQQEHLKKLKLHNFMEIDEFLKGKHTMFRKIMTSYIIYTELKQKYTKTFENKEIIRKYISNKLAGDLDEMETYIKRFNPATYISAYGDGEFIKGAINLVHDCKLYDLSIWGKFNSLKKEIEKFDFVNFFGVFVTSPNEEIRKSAITAMEDVAKQRKIKMNWENYTIFDFKNEKK